MRDYDEYQVVADLNKKHDLNVNASSRSIQQLSQNYSKGDVGIKSKGKMDFLINFRKFTHIRVSKFLL